MHKILFHLNSLAQGGAERVVSNLAHQFHKKGYEVLIATEWQGENEFVLEEGIRRIHVGLTKMDEGKSRIGKLISRATHLRACILEEKPDVVVAFTRNPNYRALLAAAGTKIPVVAAVRTDPVGHYDKRADKIQIPLLFRRAAGFVFQTEGQRDFFPEYVRKKSQIILNPLNDKYLNAPEPSEKRKEVVQSGRLVDFKNQQMLIKAFARVHEKHPDYVLKIYGPDSKDGTKEILEKEIKEQKAENFVFLMGGSDSLEKLLPEGEIFAFSSDWEGLPNALLEAMALGMPVVATDCPCGGPATVITHEKNGLLVPIKDEKAMAEGICRLIEDKELAQTLGKNAEKIRERANGEAVFEQWKAFLEKCAGK